MTLYEEIIFLQYYFKGKYIVENTISYYDPLIKPQKINRHYFWANFKIEDFKTTKSDIRNKNKICDFTDYDLSKYEVSNKRQILRNCVDSELGNHILKEAIKSIEYK